MITLLLGCSQPVIGMEIVASVTCEGGACGNLQNGVVPCQCAAPRFDPNDGVVEVERSQLTEDAAVVFSLDYDSELGLCGFDGVIEAEPRTISGIAGDPLYTLDTSGTLSPVDGAPLTSESGDGLEFDYLVAEGTSSASVHESHAVAFRDALNAEPYDDLLGCCEHVNSAGAASAVVTAGLLFGRRRSRRPMLERGPLGKGRPWPIP